MKNRRAVIFDIDGTLVNRKEAFLKFCNYLINKYSGEYPFKGTREELIEQLVKLDANGYGGLHNIIPGIARVWELPHTVEEFIRERNEIFGKLSIPYPETYEVLDALKGRYKLAVVTNGYSFVQREKIETVKISHYFEDIIVSGEVDLEKPDPGIFQLSCSHIGVKPEEAVYVGDYYPNDIAGAISAGIAPIWISDNSMEHTEYQGIRVTRLKDILEHL